MNKMGALSAAVIFLFCFSCGRGQQGASTPEEALAMLAGSRGGAEMERLYTEETLKRFYGFADGRGMDRKRAGAILRIIPAGCSCSIISKKCSDSKCLAKVELSCRNRDNAKGMEIDIVLMKESGSWKIDLRKDIEKMSASWSASSPAEYLERLKEK